MKNDDLIKQRVQKRILAASVLLLFGKFLAFFLTNSVGILTDALESIVNVAAGAVSLFSLHFAARPKDRSHPFGHGKMELISASVEGLLITSAGCWIIVEGVRRLFNPAAIEELGIGIALVALAGAVNYLLGLYSIRIGRKYDSIALVASGKHLQSDTYSSIGLVVGLGLLYLTGLAWIDSALALVFGGVIISTGVSILRKTVSNLIDQADEPMLAAISEALAKNRSEDWIDIHNTKIIKYGSWTFIDCDLTLPWYYNVIEGHTACERLTRLLEETLSDRAQVSVHSDPCYERYCDRCALPGCPHRQRPCTRQEPLTLSEITQSDEEREER